MFLPNTLKILALGSMVVCILSTCQQPSPSNLVSTAYLAAPPPGQVLLTQSLDLSVDPPVCKPGNPCANLTLTSTAGAIYRSDFNTWSLVGSSEGITLDLNLTAPLPVVLTFNVAAALVAGQPNSPVSILVNGDTLVRKYADTNPNFHPVAWKIPTSLVQAGSNTVKIALTPDATVQYFINAITVASFDEPERVISENGVLTSDLYVQFGLANITGALDASGNPVSKEIWTRAYSLMPPQPDPSDTSKWLPGEDLVPGPTLVFKPNDVMNINFVNNLNQERSQWLQDFQGSIAPSNPDDIKQHIGHEVNIPHNADNTNLHTHGLHVDPRRDNVTLLIIPEDDSPDNYHGGLKSTIPNAIGSQVPGGPPGNGKYWTWLYSYKIPADHMPGTHWFHAHKHGSTSTHVENGMAGTFVLRPEDDSNTFAPGLWNDDPDLTHDRVMVLQEIANYGIQQGSGDAKDVQPGTPDITVNGIHQPTLQLGKNQIERWRFVNAGANHRTSSYIWLGKQNGTFQDSVGGKLINIPLFENAVPENDGPTTAQMYLVALDGVTLDSPVKITAGKPLLVAAGNRADVLVRIPDDGNYAIFKNFPQAPATVKNKAQNPGGYAIPAAPSPMNTDSYNLGSNFKGYKKTWRLQPKSKDTIISMTPMLSGALDPNNRNLINIDLQNLGDAQFEGIGWQPATHGGGAIDNQLLFHVNTVDLAIENGSIPNDLSTVDLSPFSPTGSAKNLTYINGSGQPQRGQAPGYASPIEDSDVTTPPQVMVFDLSGVQFDYENSAQNGIKQFWLNGRQFNLEDYVGNTDANDLIQTPIPQEVKLENGTSIGTYNYASTSLWTNQISGLDSNAYWTNPGYYIPIIKSDTGDFYTYNYEAQTSKPDYDDLTGGIAASQPTSTTAQEWLLINNSDVFHPFHIHISPFFVTEIGQLNYDTAKASWETRYIYDDPYGTEPTRQSWEVQVDNSAVDYVVGTWWDVIMIPPHGYVKLKTWINVPWQSDDNTIAENTNNVGSWVFHCHILRHEDRGMMMVVKTKKK